MLGELAPAEESSWVKLLPQMLARLAECLELDPCSDLEGVGWRHHCLPWTSPDPVTERQSVMFWVVLCPPHVQIPHVLVLVKRAQQFAP